MQALWRKDFQQASFRGVFFETENRSLSGGRKIIAHLYPQRDEPNPEDMGLAPHYISIKAYLFGANYMVARNALIEALQKQGTGEYIDAWGRTHEVVVCEWSCEEQERMGGYVVFSIKFLEAGKQRGHSSVPDTAWQVTAQVELFLGNAMARFSLEWRPGESNATFLLACVMTDIAKHLGIDSLQKYAAELTIMPQLWGVRLFSLFAAAGKSWESISKLWIELGGCASGLQTAHVLHALMGLAVGEVKLIAKKNISLAESLLMQLLLEVEVRYEEVNTDQAKALYSLVIRLALAEAALHMTKTTFFTADEAREMGFALCEALGALRPYSTAQEYQQLADLRAAIVADTHTRAARLPELVSVKTDQSMPALVYAYKIYGSAGQEHDVLSLNPHITHPGFVPGASNVVVLRHKRRG